MIKRLITPLIAITAWLLCGCLPFQSIAQTSTEHLYKTLTGDNVRLCTDPSTGNSIISYNGHVNYMPYNFIYHKLGATTTHYYESSSGTPNTNTPDNYNVKDIEIVGDYCYFCGSYITSEYVYYMGLGMMLETTETGYIGRFPLSDIESGVSPMTIQFCIIAGTKTFSKLNGFFDGSNNYICLIGNSPSGLSCLATVKENGTGIAFELHTLPAFETITDLTLTKNYLVTVSRFEGEEYTFGLRAESTIDVVSSLGSNSPLPHFKYLNKFDTYSVNSVNNPRPEPPTSHSDKGEMGIAGVGGEDHVVVAYDCQGGAFDEVCFTDLYHTALYYVEHYLYDPTQNNLMSVTSTQLVSKGQKEEISLTGLTCPDTKYVVLFHRYPVIDDGISGEIQFPLWSSFGQIDNLSADILDMQDMYYDLSNQKINLAGNWGLDNRIVHFQQDFNNIGNSCYSTRPKAFSEKMSNPEMELIPTDIVTEFATISWGHTLNRPRKTADYIPSCETY